MQVSILDDDHDDDDGDDDDDDDDSDDDGDDAEDDVYIYSLLVEHSMIDISPNQS